MAIQDLSQLPATRKAAKESGSKVYFTGKACVYGHIAARGVSNHECRKCSEIRKHELRKDPAFNARSAISQKEYSKKNKELIAQKAKDKRKNDPDYFSNIQKNHYERNKEKYQKRSIQRAKDHPAENAARSRNRYALRRYGCEGRTYEYQILQLLERQKNKCANCLSCIKKKHHADHVMPLYLGGENHIKNIQLLCPTCNLRKNKKHPVDFARQNGRLL